MSTDLDWNFLKTASPREDCHRFEDVKHLFRKVAWDVYKPLSGSEVLWELREENGEKFLFSLYDDESDITIQSKEAPSPWSAISDHAGENVTLSWNNIPVHRFAHNEFKFSSSEANEFAGFLQKQASDERFVNDMLAQMPEAKREAVNKLINQREA